MSFLNYEGHFDGKNPNSLFKFNFKKNLILIDEPTFIVPPIYDTPFKKFFLTIARVQKF